MSRVLQSIMSKQYCTVGFLFNFWDILRTTYLIRVQDIDVLGCFWSFRCFGVLGNFEFRIFSSFVRVFWKFLVSGIFELRIFSSFECFGN